MLAPVLVKGTPAGPRSPRLPSRPWRSHALPSKPHRQLSGHNRDQRCQHGADGRSEIIFRRTDRGRAALAGGPARWQLRATHTPLPRGCPDGHPDRGAWLPGDTDQAWRWPHCRRLQPPPPDPGVSTAHLRPREGAACPALGPQGEVLSPSGSVTPETCLLGLEAQNQKLRTNFE